MPQIRQISWNGRKFYISGLFFLLIGILVGTGFFTGWSGSLGIVGGIFLWASILIEPLRSPLHGAAYMLWILSLLPIAYQLWQITKAGMVKAEAGVQQIEETTNFSN